MSRFASGARRNCSSDHPAATEIRAACGNVSAVAIESPATPYLLIDGDVLERNLARMASYVAAHDLKLRPHAKTHKSQRIARRQLRHGAVGITTSKVGEAEALRPACD